MCKPLVILFIICLFAQFNVFTYGSIPHRLIFFPLERYCFLKHWISLIKAYYSGIYSKSFSSPAPK